MRGTVLDISAPGGTRTINGERYMPAACWCDKNLVLVPVRLIQACETLACDFPTCEAHRQEVSADAEALSHAERASRARRRRDQALVS